MEFEGLSRWLGVLALLVSISNTIWVWVSQGGRRLEQWKEEVEGDIDDHDSRIQGIEGELKHLPSKDAVNALNIKLTSMDGKLGKFESELDSVARTARRIEDHLLREKA